MKIITDNPDTTRDYLPPMHEWRPADTPDLQGSYLSAWRTFGSENRAWICESHAYAGFKSRDPIIIIISQAPSSQFADATNALKECVALPDTLFCLALEGSNFRGQRNRSWNALKGNLHLTAVYKSDIKATSIDAGLTMLPAVAAAESIRAVTENRVAASIKWVNDILIDGKKAAGVLTSTQIVGDRIKSVVFGIGMNVKQAPVLEPTPFVPASTSVADHLGEFQPGLENVFWDIIVRIDNYFDILVSQGPQPLLEAYREYADIVGHRVRLWPDSTSDWIKEKPFVSGVVRSIKPDLSLRLDGVPGPVYKGRLAYEQSCRMLGL